MMLHLDSLRMDAYLEGSLSSAEAEEVTRHLEECPSCRALLETRKQLLTALGELPDTEMPELFHARLVSALHAEQARDTRRILRRRRVVPSLLTAAACLVVVAGGLTLWIGGGFSGIAQGVSAAEAETSYDTYSGNSTADNGAMLFAAPTGGTEYFSSEESDEVSADAEAPAENDLSLKGSGTAAAEDGLTEGSLLTQDIQAVAGQKLVYRADLSLESVSFDTDLAAILSVCDTYDGFVEASSVSGKAFTEPNGYGRYADLTLRIPSASYQAAAAGLKNVGSLNNFSENVTNITYTYSNAQILVENLLAQRDTLLTLLDKAESLDDVVLLQSQLNDLSTRIQQAESDVRGMDNEVDYATFTISLSEVQDASTLLVNNQEKSFFQRMQERLYTSLAGIRDGFLEGVIGFVAFLPVLAAILLPLGVIGLIVWLIVRGVKRRKARKAA